MITLNLSEQTNLIDFRHKQYYEFGPFSIASPVSFPELFEIDNPYVYRNIEVCFKNIDLPPDIILSRQFIQAFQNGEIFIQFPGVVRFLISNDDVVTVDQVLQIDDNLWKSFLVTTVISIIAAKNNILPLHGTAIKIGNKNLIILGKSGVGKTMMAAMLVARGHILLADDVSLIDSQPVHPAISEPFPCVYPTFPRLKLWEDTIKLLRVPFSGLPTIRNGLAKFNMFLGSDPGKEFSLWRPFFVPSKLDAFILLLDGECTRFRKVSLSQAQHIIQNHLVSRIGIAYTGRLKAILGIANTFADDVPMFALERPKVLEGSRLAVAALEKAFL